jgi:2-polyprenyl-3-methyl-5-hydroxy-6-metoxy-1,4-benzoquinol methylase
MKASDQSDILANRSPHRALTRLRSAYEDPVMASENTYVLGSDEQELARLDRQAAFIAPATRLLLQAAGLAAPGLRVLDLGTGLGHVARLAGQLVGPTGSVLGLDRAPQALAVARQRVEEAGESHVSFVDGEVGRWRAAEPFDAILGRLVLFHLADPIAAVRHHTQDLSPGGLFVAIDFDIGSSRSEPPVGLVDDVLGWVVAAFRSAGASPMIGAGLGPILEQAGLDGVATFGVQAYIPPRDPAGPALIAGVTRSLADVITKQGIATPEQLGIATLERRIADEIQRAQAVILPPTVVGAWGRSRAA